MSSTYFTPVTFSSTANGPAWTEQLAWHQVPIGFKDNTSGSNGEYGICIACRGTGQGIYLYVSSDGAGGTPILLTTSVGYFGRFYCAFQSTDGKLHIGFVNESTQLVYKRYALTHTSGAITGVSEEASFVVKTMANLTRDTRANFCEAIANNDTHRVICCTSEGDGTTWSVTISSWALTATSASDVTAMDGTAGTTTLSVPSGRNAHESTATVASALSTKSILVSIGECVAEYPGHNASSYFLTPTGTVGWTVPTRVDESDALYHVDTCGICPAETEGAVYRVTVGRTTGGTDNTLRFSKFSSSGALTLTAFPDVTVDDWSGDVSLWVDADGTRACFITGLYWNQYWIGRYENGSWTTNKLTDWSYTAGAGCVQHSRGLLHIQVDDTTPKVTGILFSAAASSAVTSSISIGCAPTSALAAKGAITSTVAIAAVQASSAGARVAIVSSVALGIAHAATVSGKGAVANSAAVGLVATAVLGARGAVVNTGTISALPSSIVTGSGQIASAALASVAPVALASCSGSAVSSVAVGVVESCAVSGAGAISSSIAIGAVVASSIGSAADSAVSGPVSIGVSATASASAFAAIANTVAIGVASAPNIRALGAVTESITVGVSPSANIDEAGSSAVSSTAAIGLASSNAVSGAGAVSSSAAIGVSTVATLGAQGTITSSVAISESSTTSIGGRGSVSETASIGVAHSSAAAGMGAIVDSTAIGLSATASLNEAGSSAVTSTSAVGMVPAGSLRALGAVASASAIGVSAASAASATNQTASSINVGVSPSASLVGSGDVVSGQSIGIATVSAIGSKAAASSSHSVSVLASSTLGGFANLAVAASIGLVATHALAQFWPGVTSAVPCGIEAAAQAAGFGAISSSVSVGVACAGGADSGIRELELTLSASAKMTLTLRKRRAMQHKFTDVTISGSCTYRDDTTGEVHGYTGVCWLYLCPPGANPELIEPIEVLSDNGVWRHVFMASVAGDWIGEIRTTVPAHGSSGAQVIPVADSPFTNQHG